MTSDEEQEQEVFHWDPKTSSVREMSQYDHVHNPKGTCIKNRYGELCKRPAYTDPGTPS